MLPQVSLCMIVKNEEATLSACLQSATDLVQEMILVDTGSTDRTREIGRSLGAQVHDFAWVDDFAAARNESVRLASGQWIFWLDGDERLDEENRHRLRTLFGRLTDGPAGFLMKQRSISNPATGEATVFEQVRLFPKHPEIRWHYRVHEQILPDIERLNLPVHRSDVIIEHSGYEDPNLHHRKQERNLRLLRLQEAERPNDAFTLFNLGLTHNALGQPAEAIPHWRRSLEQLSGVSSWVRKLYSLLGGAHHRLGQHSEALAVFRAGLTRFPEDLELLFLQGNLLTEMGDYAGAEASLTRLLQTKPGAYFAAGLDVGLQSFKARHGLGLVYRAQNRNAEAEAQWRAALTERPDYLPACLGLANLFLVQRRFAEMEQAVKPLEISVQGRVAAAQLRALGHSAREELAQARQVLEEALALAPENLDLLVLLSRIVLREGRDWATAEQTLRRILALNPFHTEARNNLTVLLRQLGRTPDPLPSPLADELFQRAEKALRENNLDEAAPFYRSLLHAGYQPGLMFHRLAAVSNHQSDFVGAWELHLRALAVDPSLAAKIAPTDSAHRGMVCRQTYDMEEVQRCPVCGGTAQTPMMVVNLLAFPNYHASIHPVRRWVKCPACGHGFANPRPTAAALREAYRDPPPAHLLAWTYDRLTVWSDIIHELWVRRPGGDLLDVGAGTGGLAGVALDYGYRATGIDVHPAYADHVRRLGVEFLLGDVATHDFGGRRFDLITLGDVLEHVADPVRVMEKIAALLQPDGLVWLSTPNHEGVWTRSMRERDAMWFEGEHLQFFSLRSLARLVRDRGLEMMDYRLSKRFVGCAEVIIRRATNHSVARQG